MDGRSSALSAYVDGLGLLLGPLLAVLGRSWALRWRSWAALGAYVGGPGRSWVEKWPWPEREGDLGLGLCGWGPLGPAEAP